MNGKTKLKIIILALLIAANFLFFVETRKLNSYLEVTILNIGQGDAILIKTPENKYGLIDAGKGSLVISELQEVLPISAKEFEFILLTHPDLDHIEGFIEVLKRFKVNNIFLQKTGKESLVLNEILAIVTEKNIKNYSIDVDNSFKLGELKMNIVWPNNKNYINPSGIINETSIAIELIYKDFSLFSGGDLGVDNEILSTRNLETDLDILKVGHHGSQTSTSKEFLDLGSPEICIISVGKDNTYGHPHPTVEKLLEESSCKIYRTDLDGRIKIESDGLNYKVIPE